MRFNARFSFVAWSLLACCCENSRAQLDPAAGLNGLPAIEFAQLSQQDRNPLAAKALGIHPQDWKHAETEHFIYHFQRSFVATAISVEAEFHVRVAVKQLDKEGMPWAEKAHIYIFEQPADWESFQTVGGLEPWTGGIQSGGSLFIIRNPAYKFTDNSLGHEITHLVVARFYGPRVPLWLNEGLAQYVSKGAHASYQRARGYAAKPQSTGIATEKFLPIATLTTMGYPPAAGVDTFYDESERLVRFLIAADREKFLELLQLTASGVQFEAALSQTANTYPTIDALEQQFRTYAAKDTEASLSLR